MALEPVAVMTPAKSSSIATFWVPNGFGRSFMIIVELGFREQWVTFIWTWLGGMCSGRGMSLSDRIESGEPRRVYVQARMVEELTWQH